MAYRYPTIKVDGKTTLKHRHVAEAALGRSLSPEEHVHHRDHDGWNSDPDNLEVKPGLQHIREHAEERRIHPREKPCAICGTIFVPKPTKRKRALTCSRPCANQLRSHTERQTKAAKKKAIVRANMAGAEAEREIA